ncbi:MAG: hypothetical protein ONB05_01215 [candidate division KSB1 bacterium]|nr:hypothetical protein [candidate division KSB1 bacterium]
MWIWSIIGVILLLGVGFSFWFFGRKHPDELILIERKGKVAIWKRAIYPKRLCLSLPNTIRSVTTEVKTQARGKMDAIVKLSVTFYADPEHVDNLIRIGGWSSEALVNAGKELAGTLQGIVGEIIEQIDITEMTREFIARNVKARLDDMAGNLGLQIPAVTVISAEAVDPRIAEAIKMREEARIQEDTEKAVQASRIAQAKMKAVADQKIAEAEHETLMKNFSLRKIQEAEAAALAKATVEQQAERRRVELEVEKAEIEMLAKNPSLLLLAPQLTRLAEASQQLKNAETVITISADLLNKLPQPLQQIFGLLKNAEPNDSREG